MFGVSLGKQKSQWWHWWGHGAFGPPPVGGPAPTYPSYKNKDGKILAFHIFDPLTSTPIPTKHSLVQPLCDFQSCFKACENIQWCKNTCPLAVKACKIFTWVKYKWLDKNTNWTTEKSRLHHPHPLTSPPPPYSQVRRYPQPFSSKWPQGCKRDYLGALGHFL